MFVPVATLLETSTGLGKAWPVDVLIAMAPSGISSTPLQAAWPGSRLSGWLWCCGGCQLGSKREAVGSLYGPTVNAMGMVEFGMEFT